MVAVQVTTAHAVATVKRSVTTTIAAVVKGVTLVVTVVVAIVDRVGQIGGLNAVETQTMTSKTEEILNWVLENQPAPQRGMAPIQVAFNNGLVAPGVLVKGPVDGTFTLRVAAVNAPGDTPTLVDMVFEPAAVNHVQLPTQLDTRIVRPPSNLVIPQ